MMLYEPGPDWAKWNFFIAVLQLHLEMLAQFH